MRKVPLWDNLKGSKENRESTPKGLGRRENAATLENQTRRGLGRPRSGPRSVSLPGLCGPPRSIAVWTWTVVIAPWRQGPGAHPCVAWRASLSRGRAGWRFEPNPGHHHSTQYLQGPALHGGGTSLHVLPCICVYIYRDCVWWWGVGIPFYVAGWAWYLCVCGGFCARQSLLWWKPIPPVPHAITPHEHEVTAFSRAHPTPQQA